MERLCKDELYLIFMKLNVKDLLNLSLINKKFKEKIENQWLHRLISDFPDYLNYDFGNKNKKEIYILLYQLVILKEKLWLSSNIYELYNKESLLLSREQIKIIPRQIGILINLKNLDLSGNYIRDIPKEIGNLISLEFLDLNYNRIKDIPKEIGNLINLRELSLTLNNIEKLPIELSNLSNLRKFYVYNNKMLNVQNEIKNIPGLTLYA